MGRKSNAKKKRRSQPARKPRRRIGSGTAALVGAILGIAGLLWLGSRGGTEALATGEPAPEFTLPSTGGGAVSIEDLRGGNVLLYFNEGAGCGSCFTQLVELERHSGHLGELDITLVPISPNPLETTVAEAARYGVRTPFLIDDTLEVASAYDTLGTGHHGGLPGHSFILLDDQGRYRWRGDYPGMWVSPEELLSRTRASLAT
ncbi:MAG TPA: peroxiredoxin family protein [Actinomycetota bacterium]